MTLIATVADTNLLHRGGAEGLRFAQSCAFRIPRASARYRRCRRRKDARPFKPGVHDFATHSVAAYRQSACKRSSTISFEPAPAMMYWMPVRLAWSIA
jgi:hypothetical protein